MYVRMIAPSYELVPNVVVEMMENSLMAFMMGGSVALTVALMDNKYWLA